jgi:hypothetical protein
MVVGTSGICSELDYRLPIQDHKELVVFVTYFSSRLGVNALCFHSDHKEPRVP